MGPPVAVAAEAVGVTVETAAAARVAVLAVEEEAAVAAGEVAAAAVAAATLAMALAMLAAAVSAMVVTAAVAARGSFAAYARHLIESVVSAYRTRSSAAQDRMGRILRSSQSWPQAVHSCTSLA